MRSAGSDPGAETVAPAESGAATGWRGASPAKPVWPSLGERQRLVEAVLRLPGMRNPERWARINQAVVGALGADLVNDLNEDRPGAPYEMAWELVHACLARPGGVRAFVDVVRDLSPDGREMTELDQLVRALFPHRLLEPAERAALRSLLTRFESTGLSAASRLAALDSALGLDPDLATPDDAIDRLEAMPLTADGLPPLLAFLAGMAQAGSSPPREDLRPPGRRGRQPSRIRLCGAAAAQAPLSIASRVVSRCAVSRCAVSRLNRCPGVPDVGVAESRCQAEHIAATRREPSPAVRGCGIGPATRCGGASGGR
jgi:hypothetical protein